jgi:hypothetical protein
MFIAKLQTFPPVHRVMHDSAIFRDAKVGAGRGAEYFHSVKIHAGSRFRHGVKTVLDGLRPLG